MKLRVYKSFTDIILIFNIKVSQKLSTCASKIENMHLCVDFSINVT